jgi:capsular polysaccharide biosynthesis protein
MEDEIDLRLYLRLLFRRWWLIAGGGLLAALAAAGISWATAPTYRATALLTASASTPNVATLAVSDDVLKATLAEAGLSLPPNVTNPATLRPLLAATQAANTTAVQLSVTDREAARAAGIANAWANAVSRYVNKSYSENPAPALQAQLNATTNLLTNITYSQFGVEWAIEDAHLLRERLAKQNASDIASAEDQAILLAVSLQSVSAPGNIQLQFGGAVTRTVGDQIKYLDALLDTLTTRRQTLQARQAALQTQMLDTQARLAAAQSLITAPITVQVFQSAAVPSAPISPRTNWNILLGAVVGVTGGVFLALAWEWWRAPAREQRAVPQPASPDR